MTYTLTISAWDARGLNTQQRYSDIRSIITAKQSSGFMNTVSTTVEIRFRDKDLATAAYTMACRVRKPGETVELTAFESMGSEG